MATIWKGIKASTAYRSAGKMDLCIVISSSSSKCPPGSIVLDLNQLMKKDVGTLVSSLSALSAAVANNNVDKLMSTLRSLNVVPEDLDLSGDDVRFTIVAPKHLKRMLENNLLNRGVR